MKILNAMLPWTGAPKLAGAIVLALSIVAIGAAPSPSLASLQATCEADIENGCCACYFDDDMKFHCRTNARIGASSCDSDALYCSTVPCQNLGPS